MDPADMGLAAEVAKPKPLGHRGPAALPEPSKSRQLLGYLVPLLHPRYPNGAPNPGPPWAARVRRSTHAAR